ncbi:winged helix-turn-helix domain-containing protein [Arthrobacter cavernae]|uniref:Helix-turn-helix transcriptional regulator n=1 Tax=Arthrobacter cavernae TaxID=2817681 RepID=A0A939HJS5_9MICC|nr:winged helix-turn-helix domain-containing protein [Arthrobacter cavernae]MBO1269126.1 helix-turn-helix transcriptional regulator [Arthrobacter cavernae]
MPLRHHPLRERIVAYLEANGARRTADISAAVGVPRATTQYHLAALESASVIRSDVPPDMRARSTPFYALVRLPS